MRKINSQKYNKIWGYEIWLYSPLPGKATTFVDNNQSNVGGPLIKIISTTAPLSVQVHPDDTWAQKLEGAKNGKSESWYILAANDKAQLVVGLKNYDQQIIRQKIQNNSFADLLVKVPVHAHEFINISAGLVHGIGAGITLLEVQQPSDITYRYFDYNRLENGAPRKLHIEQALKCQKNISYVLKPVSNSPLQYDTQVGSQIFLQQPYLLKENMIVVNLQTWDTFWAYKGETINFDNYVLISL